MSRRVDHRPMPRLNSSGTPAIRPPSRTDASIAESHPESSAQGAAAKSMRGRKGRPSLIGNENYLNEYSLFSQTQLQDDSQPGNEGLGLTTEEQEKEQLEEQELNQRVLNLTDKQKRAERRVTFTDIYGKFDKDRAATDDDSDFDEEATVGLTPEITQDREILKALDRGVKEFSAIVKDKPKTTHDLLLRLC